MLSTGSDGVAAEAAPSSFRTESFTTSEFLTIVI